MSKERMRYVAPLLGAGLVAGVAAERAVRRRAFPLSGKVVLITGGSSGLGFLLARKFSAEGSRVVFCGTNVSRLQWAERKLLKEGADVVAVPCDVADRRAVREMLKTAIRRFGRLDVVVNNAGIIQVGPLQSMSAEDMERAMDVMYWGVVNVSLEALPYLEEQSSSRIVNITSIGGVVAPPHLVPYSAAKSAAIAFSDGLRAETSSKGVKVVTVIPGLMRTGSHTHADFRGEQEARWFQTSATLPGLTVSAEYAANRVLEATRLGSPLVVIGTPARLGKWFHGLFGATSRRMLGLVNRWLPRAGDELPGERGDRSAGMAVGSRDRSLSES